MKLSSPASLAFAALLPSVAAQDTVTLAPTISNTVGAGGACTSSDDCRDGLFCSSTASFCLELTCPNWAAGAPDGEPPYNEDACAAEIPGETREFFCGRNGNCYAYNCENWYLYGPLEFTRYDPLNPVPLVCNDYNNGEADHMNSVVFGCRPYQPGSKAPEAKNFVHYFNQECKATPRGTDDFKCYQNKPDTNYESYKTAAERFNPTSCDPEVFGGMTEDNLFWYQVVLRQINKGEISNHKQGRNSTASSISFDEFEAGRSMFAVLETNEDIPPPRTLPPNPPTAPPDSGTSRTKWSSILMGTGLFYLSTSIIFD